MKYNIDNNITVELDKKQEIQTIDFIEIYNNENNVISILSSIIDYNDLYVYNFFIEIHNKTIEFVNEVDKKQIIIDNEKFYNIDNKKDLTDCIYTFIDYLVNNDLTFKNKFVINCSITTTL